MIKRIYIFLIFIIFLFPAHATQAQQIKPFIRVSPVIFNIALSPGKTYTYTINVENLLSTPLPLHIDTGQLHDPSEKNEEVRSLSEWISIENPDMILPAKSNRSFSFQLQTPSQIPFGGYYGVIVLEPLIPFQKTNENFLIQTKLTIPLLAQIGTPPTVAQAKITNLNVQNIFDSKKNTLVDFKVKNNSLYHFSAKPIFAIQPLFGSVQKTVGEEKVVLPGNTRVWSQLLPIYGIPGIYRLRLFVSVGNGNQISEDQWFVTVPLMKTLFIVFSLVTVFFVLWKRNKLKKTFRALTGSP